MQDKALLAPITDRRRYPSTAVPAVPLPVNGEDRGARIPLSHLFQEGEDRQSGMLSCFFQGLAICLPRRPFRARAMRRRVPWGLMTSSM